MTQQTIVAIYDRTAGIYKSLAPVAAQGQAIREFQDAINDPNNGALNKHPEDFELHKLGTWDDTTGLLERLDAPETLARGQHLKLAETATKGPTHDELRAIHEALNPLREGINKIGHILNKQNEITNELIQAKQTTKQNLFLRLIGR